MADGYNLVVDATLDDASYRARVKALAAFTVKEGAKMESALNIEADLNIKGFESQLRAVQAQKVKPKEVIVTADGKIFTSQVEYLKAQAEAKGADLNIDADTTKADTEMAGFRTRQNKPLDIPVRADTSFASAQLIGFSRGIEQVANRLGSLALISGGIGTGVAAGASLGFAGLGSAFGAGLEQDQIRLQALVKDIPAANNLLKEFKQRADIDPFDLGDYTATAAKFASATKDVNKIRELTIRATQITAQYGGELQFTAKALSDVQNKGKLAGQEVLQFANAGIPIQGLVADFLRMNGTLKNMSAEKAIREVVKLQEEGKITADIVQGALQAAVDPKITEKFANSFKGRLDLLKNSIKNTAASFVGLDLTFSGSTLVKEGGFFDTLTKSFQTFAETFNSAEFQKPLEEAGTALGKGLSTLVDQLPTIIGFLAQFLVISANITAEMLKLGGELLKTFGPQIQSGMKSVAENADVLAKVFLGLIAGGALLKVVSLLGSILTPLLAAGKALFAISGLGAAFQASSAGVVAFFGPIAAGVALIAFLGVAWVKAFTSIDGATERVRRIIGQLWKQVQPGIRLIGSGLKDALAGATAAFKPMIEVGIFFWEVLTRLKVIQGITALIGAFIKALGVGIKLVGELIGLIVKISPIGLFSKIFGDKKDADESVKVAGTIVKVSEDAAKKASDLAENQRRVFSGLADFLRSGLPELDLTSIESVKTSGEAQLTAMQTNLDNLKLLSEKGYNDLIANALQTGGVAGVELMAKYAEAVRNNDQGAIEAFKEQLLKMQKILDETAFIARVTKIETSKSLLTNLFGRGEATSYVAEYEKAYEKLIDKNYGKTKDKRKKDVDKFIKTYGKDLEDEEKKVLRGLIGEDFTEKARAEVQPGGKDEKVPPIRPGSQINPNYLAGPSLGAAAVDSSGVVAKLTDNLPSLQALQGTVAGIAQNITTTVGNVASSIGQGALTAGQAALNFGSSIVNGVTQGIMGLPGLVSNVATQLADLVGKVRGKIGETANAAYGIGSGIVNGIKNGITSMGANLANALVSVVRNAWNSMRNAVSGLWNRAKASFGNIGGFLPDFSLPGFASGTQNFGGGMALVGERGPEIVRLPQGSKIDPAHTSKKMLSQREVNVTVNQTINGVSYDDAVSKMDSASQRALRQVFA